LYNFSTAHLNMRRTRPT